jgi:hypothetical protein
LVGFAQKLDHQEPGIDSATLDKPALVIGNGESRIGIDLDSLKEHFVTIGCNALHREFIPAHLVCFDRRMAAESTENPNMNQTLIHVRKDWFHYFRKIKKNKNVRELPCLPYVADAKVDNPNNWGSGPYAVLIAAMNYDKVYLIGFDLWSKSNLLNNVYKGTKNYSKEDSLAVDPSFWIYQISKIFLLHPEKEFVIINNVNWKMPDEWKLQNVCFTNISNFEYRH